MFQSSWHCLLRKPRLAFMHDTSHPKCLDKTIDFWKCVIVSSESQSQISQYSPCQVSLRQGETDQELRHIRQTCKLWHPGLPQSRQTIERRIHKWKGWQVVDLHLYYGLHFEAFVYTNKTGSSITCGFLGSGLRSWLSELTTSVVLLVCSWLCKSSAILQHNDWLKISFSVELK